MKNKFLSALSLAMIMAMLITSLGFAAELVTAELTGTANDVTVVQGTSASFTISVSATGNVSCTQTSANPSTATVDTIYSISAGGAVSSNTPSGVMNFWASCSSTNGPVTWSGAPAAMTVSASVSAAATTPVGIYNLTLSSPAGTTDETNPNATGGKLEDTTATIIKVHVVAPPTPSDTTAPVISYTVNGLYPEVPDGLSGWYVTDAFVDWTVSDPESSFTTSGCDDVTINTDTTGTTLTCSATSAGGSSSKSVTIKRDATAPTNVAGTAARVPDHNGWYTSPVLVSFDGDDVTSDIANCSSSTYSGPDSATASVAGTCTDQAGNVGNGSFSLKYDATGPSASLAVTAGTPGTNGWYTSDVTVSTSGSDDVSGPVTCTDDQFQTAETIGQVFNGSCTNDAGLTTNAAPLTVKLDKTSPSASLSAAGTLGNNGWYVSDVTVSTTGSDDISSPVSCTDDQYQTSDTTGQLFNGSCTNDAGLTTNAAPLTIKRDATAPSVNIVAPANSGLYTLNAALASSYNCSDATSDIATCVGPVANGSNFDTATVGSKSFTVNASDQAGNTAFATNNYSVQYATGGMCLGAPGHSILQPINADGTSVFKKGSTVPAKFRVCDANGVSIGTAGVVTSFRLIQTISGTVSDVDEAVISTTPDTAFRWSSTDQQWIFNINTKSLTSGKTYVYRITLNDGSTIDFQFGLK